MRVTQWGEYGIHFATQFARAQIAASRNQQSDTLSAAEIATEQKIDLDYAQQILQRLRKSGIIESVRGPHGGYRLARPCSQITLRDILCAAEGDSFEIICETKPINTDRCLPDHYCQLRGIWYSLKEHIDNFLTSYTLDKLAEELVIVSDAPPVQIGRSAS